MNSLLWKRCIGRCYSLLISPSCNRRIILIYHAVGDGPWAISGNAFKKQIQWLKENCEIVSLTKLLTDEAQENKIQVSLTFDDGYACLYDNVLPILQSENVVATVYINSGWMSESEETRKASNPDLGHYPGENFLTWDEVKALDQAGWEIGSHGVEHIDLTKHSVEIITEELINSKNSIEEKLKKQCEHFAYTYGRHSNIVRKAVLQSKYQYAVAAHHAPLRKKNNVMVLPRLNIENGYSMDDFKNVVLGRWDYLGAIHSLKRWIKGMIDAHYFRKVK